MLDLYSNCITGANLCVLETNRAKCLGQREKRKVEINQGTSIKIDEEGRN